MTYAYNYMSAYESIPIDVEFADFMSNSDLLCLYPNTFLDKTALEDEKVELELNKICVHSVKHKHLFKYMRRHRSNPTDISQLVYLNIFQQQEYLLCFF